MKKFVTFLVCLVLAISTACMFGCDDGTFKGNYKEVSADSAEVQRFSEEAEQSSGTDNLDITKGAEMEIKVKGNAEGMSLDFSAKAKIAQVGEDDNPVLQAEGAVKGSAEYADETQGGNVNVDVKFYYTDGYAYLDGKTKTEIGGITNETELKNKLPLELEKGLSAVTGAASLIPAAGAVENVTGLVEGNIFAQIVVMAEGQENVKIYLDADARKVKVEFSEANVDGETVNGTLYLVYDEGYNVSAVKADFKLTTAESGELSVYFVFKGYAGKVKVPSAKERKEYKVMAGLEFGF